MTHKRLLLTTAILTVFAATLATWLCGRWGVLPRVTETFRRVTAAVMLRPVVHAASSSGGTSSADSVSQVRLAIARLKQAGDLPPIEFQGLAALAGSDPQAMSNYIKTYFTFEPYYGVLRGGRGSLLSNAGNDVDLMLLLRDTIRSVNNSVPVRYVHGPFPRNYKAQRRPRKPLPTLSAKQIAQVTGLDIHEVESDLTDVTDAHMTALNNAVSEEAVAIGRQLKALSIKEPSAPLPAEHWWLRVQLAGHSVDLDPLLEPGDENHKSGVEVPDLPSSIYHHLGLKLVLQRIQGDKLAEELLYQKEWKTADLAGLEPSLEILPEDFASTTLENNLSSANRFQAVIHVGDHEVEYGRVFDLDGILYTANGSNFVKTPMGSGIQGLGQSVFGQLAHGPGRPPSAESPTRPQLATLRLEIQLSSPGERTRSYRRWIVNRLDQDAQARGKFAVAPQWQALRKVRTSICRFYELLPLLGPVGPGAVTNDVNALINSELLNQATAMFERKTKADPNKLEQPPTIAESLLSGVAMLGQGLGSTEGLPQFSRPGVLLYRESLLDKSQYPTTDGAIDLVAAGTTGMTPAAAVRYGIALSYAEREASAGRAAIQTLVASRRAGIPFRLLQSPADARTLELPNAAKDTIAEQLAGGDLVLLPQKPFSRAAVAWWRVDPTDGVPIAVSANGEGQAIIEGTGLLRDVSIPQVQRTLAYVACLNVAIVGHGAAPEQANAECLCQFIGGALNSSAEKAFRTYVINGSLTKDLSGLGPQVKLILSESIKQIDKAAKFPPKQPIKAACAAIAHQR